MKIGLAPVSIAFVFASAALACANAANSNPGGFAPTADGGADAPASSVESPDDPPHALGFVQLSTTHVALATTSTPSVSAGFIPDSSKVLSQKCGKDLDGCRVLAKPDCGGSDAGFGDTGCATNEVCMLDESCDSVCQQIPECVTPCSDDEVCTVVGIKSKCIAKVEFTAGTVTLSGDGMSKTVILRPPYAPKTTSATDESPFVPGQQIAITATGASDVGIEKFNDTFTATTFIEPKPSLTKQLDQEIVFDSTDVIPLSWKAGEDAVQITVTGNKGTAICEADDAAGTFELSRKVFRQVYGADTTTSAKPTASFSLTRSRTELKKDKKTVGKIAGEDLPPVAFLRLVTSSTESYSVQGCATGEKLCPSTISGGTPSCLSTMSDRYNCGQCGKVCPSNLYYCINGVCSN